eukprot:748452-Alexandrium_andersonii.AAC.1
MATTCAWLQLSGKEPDCRQELNKLQISSFAVSLAHLRSSGGMPSGPGHFPTLIPLIISVSSVVVTSLARGLSP